MNSQAADMNQRLRQLRGSGQAPTDLWPRIEQSITPRPQRRWLRGGAIAAMLALSVLIGHNWQNADKQAGPPLAKRLAAITILSAAAALDQGIAASASHWPQLFHSAAAPLAGALAPELTAVMEARREVRMALELAPASPSLLHRMARLDRLQNQLLRDILIPA